MAKLKSALAALGQLDIEEGPDSLTIYGYRLPNKPKAIPCRLARVAQCRVPAQQANAPDASGAGD